MEPQIRYATTRDGVNIAYWVQGNGRTVVHLPLGTNCHIAEELRIAGIAYWYEQLARRYRLVRYDWRGFGSSTRAPATLGTQTLLLDLEAVIDALEVDQVVLFGAMLDGAIACGYAARHPEKVSHLILWNAVAQSPARSRPPSALLKIAKEDWRAYTKAYMGSQWGWDRASDARTYARLLRESTDANTYLRQLEAGKDLDVRQLLGSIRATTLVVLHPDVGRGRPFVASGARELASAISGAKLVHRKGLEYCPWLDRQEADESATLVEQFIEGWETTTETVSFRRVAAADTAIILFTDIADSTAITERMGDAAFRKAARALDDRMRAAIREAGGTPVEGKVLGDGVMAVFASAAQAIDAARRCVALSGESELRLHLGLHAGDVIREQDNVYGGAVNIASRICGLSAAGEILVSATIRDLARTSAGVTFEDRGDHALKGIDDPVRVFAVQAEGR